MRSKKAGTLLIIMDERLSREKSTLLSRTLQNLRSVFELELMRGASTEEDVLKKLAEKSPQLVIAPWYRYCAWNRIEAFYGLTRTSGPTFAGYFCEPLMPYELEAADHFRSILLDFAHLSATEIVLLLRALVSDSKRTGLLPLLSPDTPVYCENWYSGQGLGTRMDAVMSLPELASSQEWGHRGNSIRIALNALWSLIYEQGPGKNEFHQAITAGSPKAYFQVAADRRTLLFRLCYSMPGWSSQDALRTFWPRGGKPNEPAQLLLRYTDFVRVHRIAENNDLEIVAGFFTSETCEKAPERVHSLWIEPISANLVSEVPFEAPSPLSKHLRLLPNVPLGDARLRAEASQGAQARERFILDAAVKIRELRQVLQEREELIRELRAGGVGTAAPMPPPDMEALLEAFQERFFEARYQIRQFEVQMAQMEERGSTVGEIDSLRLRMQALATRETAWIKQLAATIETVKMARKG